MSNPKVELHIKDHGVITLELDAAKAPKTVANFLSYANKGHYANTVFHRVIPGFMVQGGGFLQSMQKIGGALRMCSGGEDGAFIFLQDTPLYTATTGLPMKKCSK